MRLAPIFISLFLLSKGVTAQADPAKHVDVLYLSEVFESDYEYSISDQGKAKLDSAYTIIKGLDLRKVKVVCYHFVQPAKSGQILSQKKAESVLEYLITLGLDCNDLSAFGNNTLDEYSSKNEKMKVRGVEIRYSLN